MHLHCKYSRFSRSKLKIDISHEFRCSDAIFEYLPVSRFVLSVSIFIDFILIDEDELMW